MIYKKEAPIELIRSYFGYDPETGILSRNGIPVGYKNDRGYLVVNWYKRIWKIHRLAWAHYYGSWPVNDIDHDDTDKTNNRIKNLIDRTRSANVLKGGLRSDNTSGHRGICFDKSRNKWMVRLDRKHIGRYNTLEEAIAANPTQVQS